MPDRSSHNQKSSSLEKIQKAENSYDQIERPSKLEDRSSKTSSTTRQEKITLGICAMKRKVGSKPMKEILSRLKCPQIEILEMFEYLEEPYETWPKVEALICFHSDGFPFLQAWRYVKKHKPFLINNLDKQQLLWDRTAVYDTLKKIRVPLAKHYMVFRDLKYLDQIENRGNATHMFGECEEDSIPLMKKVTNADNRVSDTKVHSPKGSEAQTETLNPRNSGGSNGLKNEEKKGNSDRQIAEVGQKDSNLSTSRVNRKSRMDRSIEEKGKNVNLSSSLKKSKQSSVQSKKKRANRHNSLLYNEENTATLEEVRSRKSKNAEKSISVANANPFRRKQTNVTIGQQFPTALRDYHNKKMSDLENYEVEEIDDAILLKSTRSGKEHKLKKPFVEKPFDSENHNICIYYPESMGGGRKMLFRKIKDVSSQYQPKENNIRTDGNYIYEQFLPTNAFDIKVYTIGAYYMYAEARRSPTLDGVVERDTNGKEKRFPVILTPEEKFLCSKIVQEFEQEVCGFDLLRAAGNSYVCDVNGWSFVKGNPKYWDDCAIILRRKIFKRFLPHLLNNENSKYERFSNNLQNEYRPPMDRVSTKNEELRSIVSIFRHGDRSPKLKMKIKTSDKRFLQFFKGTKKDELKLKDAKSLTRILNITNELIVEIGDITKNEFKDFSQMKAVLESGGRFEGFNRKLQMKVIDRESEPNSEGIFEVKKILIVLKWGGELSYIGYNDAFELGQKMRQERYDDDHDFLSLYSSYKHDLKTYSSDEGRCIKTAAAFLKGFLNISGSLAPIITSMVNFTKKAQSLLDCTSEQNHSTMTDSIKEKLSEMMNSNEQLYESILKNANLEELNAEMVKVMKEIGNPKKKLEQMKDLIVELVEILQELEFDNWHQDNQKDVESHEETEPEALIIIYKRWSKLQKDFYDPQKDVYNISKVPEIFDNIRYDLRKNGPIFEQLEFKVDELYDLAKLLAYFVVPNEYGMNDKEKLKTAKDIVSPLLEKILVDLMFWKNKKYEDLYWKYEQANEEDNWKHIRTRLYFTSASHMYSILNIVCLGNNRELPNKTPKEEAEKAINQLYMSYLSHIEFRMYENMRAAENDDDRFRLEVSISSEFKKGHKLKEFFLGGKGFSINTIQSFFEKVLSERGSQMMANVDKLVDESIF